MCKIKVQFFIYYDKILKTLTQNEHNKLME
jgi:hypothetical protein